MDKKFIPAKFEQKLYQKWERSGAFSPNPKGKGAFSILLPPPNANASLHAGHAMFVIEDLLIRYKRMLGAKTVWFPGTDHAGIETQFVYEKHLKKKGKSRFDFNRDELFANIRQFVKDNQGLILTQLKRLGFSLTWEKEKYTLTDEVEKLVYTTFKKLYTEKLAYRDYQLVNYCTKCGTSFSNLEVKYIEQTDPLYFLKYGPFTLATVRPETKFGDTAVAVHPDDKRYKKWVGKTITTDGLLGKFKIKVIADKAVDPEFGTGVVKVTPAHDPDDFEMGKRHNLEIRQVIGYDGRLNELTGPYAGLKVLTAREKTVEDLTKKGLITKINKKYQHRIGVCYRCQHIIEPLPMAQWFVKTSQLIKPAQKAVNTGETQIIPKRFVKIFHQWADNFKDWNISRQIVWGFRMPVWYDVVKNPKLKVRFLNKKQKVVKGEIKDLLKKYTLAEVKKGLQNLMAPIDAKFTISQNSPGVNFIQETDTFDTWFSSSLWPLICTDYPDGADFKNYYPTDVLDTMHDILVFWVIRMMIMGKYLTGKSPFKTVYLHSMVTDRAGAKMSKSKGNVVNPIELVDKYGADALRMALLVGSAPGNPIALSEEKVKGYRNFANKIWNIGRFTWMHFDRIDQNIPFYTDKIKGLKPEDKKIIKKLNQTVKKATKYLDSFRFSQAGETIYDFTWHTLADWYIEAIKDRLYQDDLAALATLRHVLLNTLKLIHPYMPYVTEAVWQHIPRKYNEMLIVSQWPN
jgi:valyl-tRNA synthetase